jgi:hypothetical protein
MRRQLFDESTGEWLPGVPKASPGLGRLLCKPLKHLWQDSPESRARDGNARWAPAVSEYRQTQLQYPLQHAAEGMLTAEAPSDAGTLQAATASLAATGRCALRGRALGLGWMRTRQPAVVLCRGVTSMLPDVRRAILLHRLDAGATVSKERPSTAQRQRGRVPLAVLAAPASAATGGEAAHAPLLPTDSMQSSKSRDGASPSAHEGQEMRPAAPVSASQRDASKPLAFKVRMLQTQHGCGHVHEMLCGVPASPTCRATCVCMVLLHCRCCCRLSGRAPSSPLRTAAGAPRPAAAGPT